MARLLSDIATSSVCPSIPKSDIISSRVCGVLPTLTAMTTSAPCARATSTGTLFRIPPSASSRPSMTTGANAVGSDIVARIAREKDPLPNTTGSPFSMSVATQRNGVGSSSNDDTA